MWCYGVFSDKGLPMEENRTQLGKQHGKSSDLSENQQIVRAVRNRMGLKQREFAELLKISPDYVSMVERGAKEPSERLTKLIALIEAKTKPSSDQLPSTPLKAARESKGLTVKELASATGYGIGYIQALEDNGARISEKFAEKVAAVLGIDKEDLMRGSDQVPSLGIGEGVVGSTPNIITTDGIKARNIPLISMAQAGELIDYTDAIYDYESITAFDVKDSKAIAIRIKGDSMSPEFPEGVIAVVCPSYEAQTGDYVIAKLGAGGVVFKKLERVGTTYRFISSNPAYEMFTVEQSEITWCHPVDQVIRKVR